jgi:hypothetical protein
MFDRTGEPAADPAEGSFDDRPPMGFRRQMIGLHSHILLQATWLCRIAKSLQHLTCQSRQRALAAIDVGEAIDLSRAFRSSKRIGLPFVKNGPSP